MADDFFGPPLDLPEDVPAEIQIDGAVTEDNTGEQVANEGGNPAWWDDNYPGQTQTAPAPAPDEYSAETARLERQNETAVGTPTSVEVNPYNGLTDDQLRRLGDADPTDPIIRYRLGLPQLEGAPPLPGDKGFYNSLKDVATAATPILQKALSAYTSSPGSPSQNPYGQLLSLGQKAVSALTTKTPATSPYPQTSVIQRSQSALTSNAATPTQDEYGLTILNAEQTAQLNAKVNPVLINGLAPTVDTGAGADIAAANQQTAADAARLNAESPNPYLANINKAADEIAKGQAGIATANQTIQSAQQKISDSESYIAQNNAELADPNISDARRAELEANNAAQVQNIADQTQSISENQAYITSTQEIIQSNEATIDTNSAGYRASTSGSNVPVVDVNADPNFVGPQQISVTAAANTLSRAVSAPAAVASGDTGFTAAAGAAAAVLVGANPDAEQEAALAAQVGRALAQQQAVLAAQKRVVNNSDWRVRLQLAPGAQYLYNAPQPGILWPLRQTDGVIFPYTPKIQFNYKADYESTPLTHSNYKGYFYKSSSAEPISLNAMFTAQDTSEAEYLLAVIHFFRSATKMFYGQDPNRGAPPPLVYLTGLGEYQFTQHPCVIANFNYSLPSDVDYIRARSTNINGTNLLTRRDQQSLPTNPISGAVARLQNLFNSQGINKGALFFPPPVPNLGQNQPTYVPTRMEIDLTLYPMQSRQQVSRVFDNRQYNNGAQLKGGFW